MTSDYLSHLEELRRRIFYCLAVFLFLAVLAYCFSKPLLHLLTYPLQRSAAKLYFNRPHEAFFIHIKAALLAALVSGAPFYITQAWYFVSPGLYDKEKRLIFPIIGVSILLFAIGVLFAYFLVIPWGLEFLLSFQTEFMLPLLGLDAYFSFVTSMIVSFGVIFNFPIVIIGLSKLGVLKIAQLGKSRKIVIVFIFIIAAILTPSPDPFSQLLLAIPLWGLFELTLIAGRLIENRKNS